MATNPRYFDNDELEIPSRTATEDAKLEYCNYAIAKGLSFLKAQPAYADVDKGRAIIHAMETYSEAIPDKLSHVRVPRLKRQIREIVATLSNLRPTWDYVSNNPFMYESQANVLNKLHRAWYFNEEVDRSIRQALQFAAVEGTGYLYLTWEKPLRASTGRIKLTPLGAMQYIPFQQSLDNKVQNAEVGVICTEIPVARARRLYHKPDLQPTNTTATNLVKGGIRELVTNIMSPYLRASGPNRRRQSESNTPTVNIYHLYIKDDSINKSGNPVKMGEFNAKGEPATSFSYIVPSLNDPIPTGRYFPTDQINPMTGEPVLEAETRPAEAADCLLYPNLRLIMCTPDEILYDGPSMWWHAQIPVVRFRFDDWPWNFLGFSLVRDTWRLEESINSRLRARDDSANARLNPAIMYDSRMSEEFDKNFTPRIPGGRIVKPPMTDKPVELVVPIETYTVPALTETEIMEDEKRLDFLLGVSQLDELMRLKQLPQSDSLDKLIGAGSSIIIDLARNMEASIRELGEMWKATAFQYNTTSMRLRLLGEDGITPEDFDFDPGNMIPSHLPGEDPTKPSRATKMERARAHIDSFQFNVVPNSLTQISAITKKMMALQLWRDPTFPKDPWSLAEDLDIPNMGPVPPDCHDRIDRFKAWMTMLAQLQQEIAGQAQGGGSDPLALVQQMLGGQGQVGRPPSGNAPPHFKQRTDGSQTVAESK